MLPAPPAVAPTSAAGFGILIEEFLIGLGMGFAMRAVFAAVEMAGEFIGLQMGLGFATFYDPLSSGQTPVVTEFVNLLALLVFLAINGPYSTSRPWPKVSPPFPSAASCRRKAGKIWHPWAPSSSRAGCSLPYRSWSR